MLCYILPVCVTWKKLRCFSTPMVRSALELWDTHPMASLCVCVCVFVITNSRGTSSSGQWPTCTWPVMQRVMVFLEIKLEWKILKFQLSKGIGFRCSQNQIIPSAKHILSFYFLSFLMIRSSCTEYSSKAYPSLVWVWDSCMLLDLT